MFKNQRCPYTYKGMRCELEQGHRASHRALDLETKTFVTWRGGREPIEIPPDWNLPKEKTSKPIIGWRWWKIGRRGILTSITSEYQWESPVASTKLNSEGEPCEVCPMNPIGNWKARGIVDDPNSNLDWGIFSYKTPALLKKHNPILFTQLKYLEFDNYLVIGKVEATKGIEHEFGYRTKDAIVRELWLFHNRADIVFNTGFKKMTERRYDCDLHFVHADKMDGWITFYSQPEERPNA